MKRFFGLTFRPFFVLTGIGTALAGLYAFWPVWGGNDRENQFRPRLHNCSAALGHNGRADGRLHDRRGLSQGLAGPNSYLQRFREIIHGLSGGDEHKPHLLARILGWRWDGRHGRPIHSRLLRSMRL